jgi:Multicopper oxidase
VHFGDYTDPAPPYMYHCHLLQHEDHGMMGQFLVVRRGNAVGPVGPVGPPTAAVDHLHMHHAA